MTKTLKNILILVLSAFAFLCAGVFFAGCQVDYSKISLSSDKTSISLEVGQSTDLVFTIENYQSGFDNRLQIDPLTDGETAIFSVSNQRQISENQVRVTVTGVAGGHATLRAKTLEADKQCSVEVGVTQYASSMASNKQILYVSTETAFVPTSNLFNFDANTTYDKLSYFLLKPRADINFATYTLAGIDDSVVTFSDGVGGAAYGDIEKFDKVSLDFDEDSSSYKLIFDCEDEIFEEELVSQFLCLSVYDFSVDNPDYEKILYSVDTVNVLPALNVKISGGYVDQNTGYADFKGLNEDPIKIVPNNKNMREYILKLEMNDVVVDAPLSISKSQSNEYVNIDIFDYTEQTPVSGKVYYWKITYNSQVQNTTDVSFKIFYDIAQKIDDESVNVEKGFKVSLEIAPYALTVNGTSEPEELTLYNFYRFPDFGWNELMIDVLSGTGVSPNFDGIYFVYDSNYLDLIYEGVTVTSGKGSLYTNLATPFYVRGKYGTTQGDTMLEVHLVSQILQDRDEIVVEVPCTIIAGATQVTLQAKYQGYLYLDRAISQQAFDEQVYADQKFQSISYSLLSGADVVNVVADNDNPCLEKEGEEGRYYLNISLQPKSTGIGVYRIFLDNGMYIDLTFNVINTLQKEASRIVLTDDGNELVTNFDALENLNVGTNYDGAWEMEILNSSTRNEITFGSVANLKVEANTIADGIKFTPDNIRYISVAKKTANVFAITTVNNNGNTDIIFTLTGYEIEDFVTKQKELKFLVRVSSYSLANEFYLQNEGGRAFNNTVYFGSGLAENDNALFVNFEAVANHSDSSNFRQYFFDQKAFVDVFENASESNGTYSYAIQDQQVLLELVKEKYDKKFVYFMAQNLSGGAFATISTQVTVTKTPVAGNSEGKTIFLTLPRGLMFYCDDITYVEVDGIGRQVATYTVEFSNVFSIGAFGEFDITNFTYKNKFPSSYDFVLRSYLEQRNNSRSYYATISCRPYQSVESISLGTALTELNFSNNNLKYTLTVFTYPINTTNKNIRVEFVRTNGNPYADMLTQKIDYSQRENGIYTIELSCEEFYNNHTDEIVNIKDFLTGMLYIYPAEWGESYTSINSTLEPIRLDVQYRNGSKNNPYILETAEDVAKINSNEVTLRSHYSLSTVIDLQTLKDFTPIGILDGKVVGFSGTIVGTNSQASIINVNISQTNFAKVVTKAEDDTLESDALFAGLFAKINPYIEDIKDVNGNVVRKEIRPSLENVTISGSIQADFSKLSFTTAQVGVLTAQNDGRLTNVAVRVGKSSISTNKKLYFGGVAGVNNGEIMQDFLQYALGDQENKVERGKYAGQNSKILAYFNDFLSVNVDSSKDIYAGGIAGVNYGTIERITSDAVAMYGYSGYSAFTLLKVSGNNGNVYVGGVAGGTYVKDGTVSSLINLLVGGEIDSSLCENLIDNVGGIVGEADTSGKAEIKIFRNTSRAFLRGWLNVGTICGRDVYASDYSNLTNFGNEKDSSGNDIKTSNVAEAVDDGRNTFYSAQVIRLKDVTGAPEPVTDNLGTLNGAFYAIGNQTTGGRSYDGFTFSHSSYLSRDKVESASEVIKNDSSTTATYGDYLILNENKFSKQYSFYPKDVSIGTDKTDFVIDQAANVYFMHYFAVQGAISEGFEGNAQDNIEVLNYHVAGSQFYPFKITSQDVNILSGSSDILSVDVNGNLTVKGTGLATITLSSILNQVVTKNIYLFVVNYFDPNVKTSLFYTSPSVNSVNITNGSVVNVYGNSGINVYLVPSYKLEKTNSYLGENDEFAISSEGVLNYRNVNYRLSKNTQMGVEVKPVEVPRFSVAQTNKQTIVFMKDKTQTPSQDDEDHYTLVPVLRCVVGAYTYIFVLNDAKVDLRVVYKERATAIRVENTFVRIPANEHYSDSVSVISPNSDEMLFYEIFDEVGNSIQKRLPGSVNDVTNWSDFINNHISEKDLFNFRITKTVNTFSYTFAVNTTSTRFLNRFNDNIYGTYTVRLYANELTDGVEGYFRVQVDEVQVLNVDVNNYSDMRDLAKPDFVVVPAQTGLLEIAIDPVEAVFDKVTVSNNLINSLDGATRASFTFVYEKITDGVVEYVQNPNFGQSQNGEFFFTYEELLELYKQINKEAGKEVVSYTGKTFVAYYMPSSSVDNGVQVGFDVVVSYSDGEEILTPIKLTTKLSNSAKLSFDDKQEVDGKVFVARGLEYSLSLNLYGYTENQVQFAVSDPDFATLTGENGKYTLQISSNRPRYNDDIGYLVTITTTAAKEVDGIRVETSDVLSIYIMEYVFNYVYQPGVNEDVVDGMQNGVIYTAIGNPFELKLNIYDFLEYDASDSDVLREVDAFVSNMTSQIEWTVHYDRKTEVLENGKSFRDDNNYFLINSFTVTPLRIYSPQSNIYHFSASGHFTVHEGEYAYSELVTNAEELYTEFAFEVHEQSTDESPIPIETYEDFLNMRDGEWYILTKDIDLVGSELAQSTGQQEFKPITANIAGLDGNSYKLRLANTYNMTGLSSVGLFENVSENTILKNITIWLMSDTVFRLDSSNFNVGILAATNNGVITNCRVQSMNGSQFSVTSSVAATDSYVAGLVGTNNGKITNSQSMVNIFANVNLSGFVGQNAGLIASSYFMGGSLSNKNSDRTSLVRTAGFAVVNSGSIHTSYVSGTQRAGSIYYDGNENSIESSNNITGFVYANSGSVEDCYSNIKLTLSGAFASGFAIENSGTIERCISTSVLQGKKSDSFAFLMTNDQAAGEARVENCFFLQDDEANVNVGIEEIRDENVDVEPLEIAGFKMTDENGKFTKENAFKEFVVASGRNANSVWFYNENESDLTNFNGSIFGLKRIELVAPNIIASSRRILDGIEEVTDPETGATYNVYKYIYDSSYPRLGSMENPIVIADAEDMETYIKQESNSLGYNYSHFRLIDDVDYSEYLYNSSLYKTKFMGYLEGNFMSISGVSLLSSEKMTFAGLFAEVGNSSMSSAIGTLMNFSYTPNRVVFSNTNVVGAVAGKLDGGNVINVDVLTNSTTATVVSGNNIVGGAIGLGLGKYKIQNLYSQISAKARNQEVEGNNFDESVQNYNSYSFAGSVAGVLSGDGEIYNCLTDTQVSVLAHKAGLMFGLLDSGVTIEKVRLEMSANMLVNAYSYGGLVAGESKGIVSGVEIVGSGTFANFKKLPYTPESVGGFAGLVSGGVISDVTMTQSISISSSNETDGINCLGGVAGTVSAPTSFKNIIVRANLTGFKYVGGVVGLVEESAGLVEFEDINVVCNLAVYGHKMTKTALGGLVGEARSVVRLTSDFGDLIEESELESLEQLKIELAAAQKQLDTYRDLLVAWGVTNGDEIDEDNDDAKTKDLKNDIQEVKEKIAELNSIYEIEISLVKEEKGNFFNVEVSGVIYVYETGIENFVGAIIGCDSSALSHQISSTISKVTGNIAVYNMSVTGSNDSDTVKVVEKENALDPYELQHSNASPFVQVANKAGEACFYDCNVTFSKTITNGDGESGYLTVTLFGEPLII